MTLEAGEIFPGFSAGLGAEASIQGTKSPLAGAVHWRHAGRHSSVSQAAPGENGSQRFERPKKCASRPALLYNLKSMPDSSTPSLQAILQIKVTLEWIKPPVWRRLLVPAGLTLAQLHDVLQAAMPWEDSHLHEFQIGRSHYGAPMPSMGFPGEPAIKNERRVHVWQVLGGPGAKAKYIYDFGDGWEHTIRVEKVLAAEPGETYPVCVAGKRRCPPEDCGGIPGFYNLLETLADPNQEDHQEMLDWVGGSFDPEEFSLEEANARLAALRPRGSRARKKAAGRS